MRINLINAIFISTKEIDKISSSILHQINIITHIAAGSLALLTGLIAILAKKGGKVHANSGKIFLCLLLVVITTGLIGVLVFGRNTFLLVITMLTAYLGFSGYRALKAKSNRLKALDVFAAIITLVSVLYFIYYFRSIGMIWSPVIIYSTVGYLFFVISYDFIRYLIPPTIYGNLWLYEHILKMISAFSGILSAFTGTVFPQYQPYSQFLPSVIGTFTSISFMIYTYKKRVKPLKSKPIYNGQTSL
ncbi:MAG: hypothetical protein P0Y49_10595 [Candidatus Pedobacter colombiensis]|uniref:DUF2306 domain-containing protein n=1 Tax=Candidatus Pedobacter colombiensis TaxID=3121371 RepID=A0AAJ6B8P2_9SPHI|nr:hypothetical protein [Pedobacter sp.]WEK21585.1 MAG: hypothetical protein P0Y49_10595 [Pedobacter sp.]